MTPQNYTKLQSLPCYWQHVYCRQGNVYIWRNVQYLGTEKEETNGDTVRMRENEREKEVERHPFEPTSSTKEHANTADLCFADLIISYFVSVHSWAGRITHPCPPISRTSPECSSAKTPSPSSNSKRRRCRAASRDFNSCHQMGSKNTTEASKRGWIYDG